MRRILIGALLLGACNNSKSPTAIRPAEPVMRTVTAASLDSLPEVEPREGRLLCLSDGKSPCPTGTAAANWLHDGRYAIWELNKPITLWTPSKTDPELLGAVGATDSQYEAIFSVAATSSGYIVLNLNPAKAVLYDRKGRYTANLPIPPITMTRTRAFAGDVSFLQLINETMPDSAAAFEVRLTEAPGDTAGHSILKTTLPWLRLRDGRTTAPVPLFPTLPAYAITADSDIVWTSGDLLNVERRGADGKVRWQLKSDAPGPEFPTAEVKKLRDALPADNPDQLRAFDSSAKHTGKFLPAVSNVFVAPDGRVLVAGPNYAASDSVRYVILGSLGEPLLRFAMPRRTRPLLFSGDSVLTYRPGANAQQEVRWLVVKQK